MKYFSPSLLDGSVTTAKLANGAVTNPKIGGNAVSESQLQTASVRARTVQNGTMNQGHLDTTSVSTAGSIPATSFLDITLLPYCFWPMIHSVQPPDVWVSGHLTDAPGADNPRLSLNNSGVVARAYDVDYRYIVA